MNTAAVHVGFTTHAQMYLKLPPELENSQIEIIIDLDDPDRQVQAEVKRVRLIVVMWLCGNVANLPTHSVWRRKWVWRAETGTRRSRFRLSSPRMLARHQPCLLHPLKPLRARCVCWTTCCGCYPVGISMGITCRMTVGGGGHGKWWPAG